MTLLSGALATLNAGGRCVCDPMDAFGWLTEGDGALDSFTCTVSDGALRESAGILIDIAGVAGAPEFTTPGVFTMAPGDIAMGVVAAADAQGDAVGYAIAGGANAALSAIDPVTGALSFPAPPAGGSCDVAVAASDGAATAMQAVAVTAAPSLAAIGEVAHLPVGASRRTPTFANACMAPWRSRRRPASTRSAPRGSGT